MYAEYVDILARQTQMVFQEMTGTEVLNYKVKIDEKGGEIAPYMHVISYEHVKKHVKGEFVLGFANTKMSLAVASALAEHMGLSALTEMNDIALDLINEFLNTIVGRTISEWDRNDMPVRFSPPEFRTSGSEPVEKKMASSVAYLIDLSLTFSNVSFQVTFSEESPSATESLRVMVVEDSAVIRNVIAKTLERCKFVVEQADNGRRAVELFDTFQPHLVVMDLVMPEMGGLEAIETIKAGHPNAEFIVLTSSARRDEILRAKRLGVRSYLIKPFKPEKLLENVYKVFKRGCD